MGRLKCTVCVWCLLFSDCCAGEDAASHHVLEQILSSASSASREEMVKGLAKVDAKGVLTSLTYFLNHPDELPNEWERTVQLSLVKRQPLTAIMDCLRMIHDSAISAHALQKLSSESVRCFGCMRLREAKEHEVMMLDPSPVVRALCCRCVRGDDSESLCIALLADPDPLVRSASVRAIGKRWPAFSDDQQRVVLLMLFQFCRDSRDEVLIEDKIVDLPPVQRLSDVVDRIIWSVILTKLHSQFTMPPLPVDSLPTPGVSCLGTISFRVLWSIDPVRAKSAGLLVVNAKDQNEAPEKKLRLQLNSLLTRARGAGD